VTRRLTVGRVGFEIRPFAVALLVVGAMSGSVAAPAAHADGPCLFQGDWNCSGSPQWNGQLQPSWEVPPYTWPKSQLQCNPSTQVCYPAVRP
jgi:hypothetical protein